MNNSVGSKATAVAYFKEAPQEPEPTPGSKKIQGYFRIANGNGKIVQVTGPFTATPSVDAEDAVTMPGTIMYVEAVEENDGSYRLTHLRCQGIDVVGVEDFEASKYGEVLADIADDLLNRDDMFNYIAYSLVRKGFEYGYTNIARATIGTVFWIVASVLDGKTKDDDAYGYEYTDNDYVNVANDFNEKVTATLDLGIRLKPVGDRTVQVYFNVPSFQPVCDWYNDTDAEIEGGAKRHEVFASAMRTMSSYLTVKKIYLEKFLKEDVELFNSWGYDMTKDYEANDDGNIELKFHDIFSDPVLLFNWIKMVGYYMLNADKDPGHGLSNLGFGSLAENADKHYLTSLLVSYLPRIHHNSTAYLINGRVGADGQAGGTFDDSKVGTLGFASSSELAAAGKYANWTLEPLDYSDEYHKFMVEHVVDVKGNNYSALFYDFPVSAMDEKTEIKTLDPEAEDRKEIMPNRHYNWNKFEHKGTSAGRQEPFILVTNGDTRADLLVGDGVCIFGDQVYGNNTEDLYTYAANVAVVKDTDEATEEETESTPVKGLQGILLPTSLNKNSDDLKNLWGDESGEPVYTLKTNKDKTEYHNDLLSFIKNESGTVSNQAVYKPAIPSTEDVIYVGEEEPEALSGVEDVIIDNVEDDVIYDLRGIRITNPLPGNIYIKNGKKILL